MTILQQVLSNNNDTKFKLTVLFNHYKTGEFTIKERTIYDNMLVYCRSGSGQYIVNHVPYDIKPNRIIFIPSNLLHEAFQDNSDPISVIAVRFSTTNAEGLEIFPHVGLVFDLDEHNSILPIIENLSSFYMLDDVTENLRETMNHHLLQSLFWNLLATQKLEEHTFTDTMIHKAMLYINDQLYRSEAIELQDVLQHLNLNHYEFLKRFKIATGKTFRTYLFEKKMRLAETYLASGEYSIIEVAMKLGYSDRYIFSNQFKKYTGKTPTSV